MADGVMTGRDFFRGKKVLVMGLGRFEGGVDSASFASQAGAEVVVTDLADQTRLQEAIAQLSNCTNIEYHLGGHRNSDFDAGSDVEVVIVNPAVNPANQYLETARRAGKIITSQMEIFFSLCPALIVGVTGSNGKSTTTAITAHLLEAACGQTGVEYRKVWMGGNIGNKPLLMMLDQITDRDIVVLEISSFQLEQLGSSALAPDVSVITNLTPNHLDRHGTFDAYCAVKENIFRFQKPDTTKPAVSIFNGEDEITSKWFGCYNGQTGRKCIAFRVEDVPAALAAKFQLVGRMNLSNLAAALAVAGHFGAGAEQIRQAVESFKALPHRLEFIAEIDGARWYNDSKSTTPVSSIAALDAFDRPRIIIAGGYDKKVSFARFGAKIASCAKAAILIGTTAEQIADAIKTAGPSGVRVQIVPSLADAVNLARSLAVCGDVVLLSTACASYDMFTNYQQRGEVFRSLVTRFEQS